MEIFVFSYNRGRYLRNCLDSLNRHAPGYPVTVVDDGSDDPGTRQVLSDSDGAVRVVINEQGGDTSLGGLYPNMNWALDAARHDWTLFIQDDMQMVRDLDAPAMAHIERFFEQYPRSVEFQPCFMKASTKASVGDGLVLDRDIPIYLRETTRSNRAFFSAVGLFHAARMREQGIRLCDSEAKNQDLIRERADRMGLSPYPFMMWLPFPESVKFRRKGLFQRYAEWRAGAGLYPLEAMTTADQAGLFERDLTVLPIAERFLRPKGHSSQDKEWMYAVALHYRLSRKMLKFRKRRRGEIRRKH